MAATPSIDLSGWLSEQLTQASPDLLRQIPGTGAGWPVLAAEQRRHHTHGRVGERTRPQRYETETS